jgi:hypothetical protein
MTVLRMTRAERRLAKPNHSLGRNQHDHTLHVVTTAMGYVNTCDIVARRDAGHGTACVEPYPGG